MYRYCFAVRRDFVKRHLSSCSSSCSATRERDADGPETRETSSDPAVSGIPHFRSPQTTTLCTQTITTPQSYYGRYILESYVRRKILSAVTQLTSNSILTELVGAVGCGGWSSCLASWVSCKIRVDRESSRFRSVCLCAAALPPVSCE